MTAVGAPLALTGLKAINARAITPGKAETAGMLAQVEADKPFSAEQMVAEMAQGLKRQDETQAVAVFRNGGRIVGAVYADGSATSVSGGALNGVRRGSESVAEFVDAAVAGFRKFYGDGLSVERRLNGDGPTQRELDDVMFPNGASALASALRARNYVAYDMETLAALSGA